MRAANLAAGVSVAGLLIPEAIAYAGIAGLAPVHALIASVLGLAAYACVGHSRFAIVAPTSASAAILAASVASLGVSGTGGVGRQLLAGALVLLTGLLFLAAAAVRIGHLAAFISRPVLRGFAFGLAVTIVIRQWPHLVGVAGSGGGPVQILIDVGARVPQWNLPSLAIGCAAYAGLRLLKRIAMLPAAFVVIASGIALAWSVDLPVHGVALVGHIDLASVRLSLPELGREDWLRVAELAVPLVVILYAESWGSIRTLALRHGDEIDPNRELAALGAANLLSGALQGLPVGAGFSASSANEDAGARGRASGLVAAATLVALLVAAGPALALLPEPVLAAIVISALTHALDPRPLLALWRLGRDEVLAAGAALAVLAFGVLPGMMLAVLLSILAAVRRFSQARVAVLGELGGSRNYVDVARHPEARVLTGVLIVRPEEPLFFANAELALAQVRSLAEQHSDDLVLVLSLEESIDLDSTAVEALAEFGAWAGRSRRRVLLARAKDEVQELLLRAGGTAAAMPRFRSVADAADAARDLASGPT